MLKFKILLIHLMCVLCLFNFCYAIYDSMPIISDTAISYLQNCPDELCIDNKLNAVFELLKSNNLIVSNQLLNSIDILILSNDQKIKFYLLQSNLYLQKNNIGASKKVLTEIDKLANINKKYENYYLKTKEKLYMKNNEILLAELAKIELINISQNAIISNKTLHDIFYNLQLIKLKTLKKLVNRNLNINLKGWLELAILAKTNSKNNDLAKFKNDIYLWTNKYPKHPANHILNNNFININLNNKSSINISLLLPLHGQYASIGKSIENGFIEEYFKNKSINSDNKNISVYDTASKNIITVYTQVLQKNPNFIIGPLQKSDVEKISTIEYKAPTLALNYLDNKKPFTNLIQFGLAVQTQINDITKNMRHNNVNNILIITPDNKVGKKIKDKFTSAWLKSHGEIAASFSYKKYNFATQISDFLQVSYSKKRIDTLNKILNVKLQTTTKRRNDFDGIFFFAESKDAKIINPLLKFNYIDSIKIFSLNNIYNKSQMFNQDLDGIYTTEYPAVIKNDVNEFAALGADCFTIIDHISKLIYAPNFMISGATGKLYFTTNGKIFQKLSAAQFFDGKPKYIF